MILEGTMNDSTSHSRDSTISGIDKGIEHSISTTLMRVDLALNAVVTTKSCIHPMELLDSKSMAVRILDQMPPQMNNGGTSIDVDAFVSIFISLKTECVYSPLTHHRLVRITKRTWKYLKSREAEILCSIGWNLYKGALESVE